MENRIIKYRAWEKRTKEIIPVDDIDFTNKQINTKSAWRYLWEVELMQFTGLYDINGKEIYEGDIIFEYPENRQKTYLGEGSPEGFSEILPIYEVRDDLPRKPLQDIIVNKGIVIFSSPEFRLKYVKEKLDGATSFSLYYNAPYEVIGNIYENPELL